MASTTDSSVLVVSKPQNAAQSLTTMPPPITSEPRLMVPAWKHAKAMWEVESRVKTANDGDLRLKGLAATMTIRLDLARWCEDGPAHKTRLMPINPCFLFLFLTLLTIPP
eukprot:TRINITY_DN6078_c0_g1_i2.p2 TRINITY_DN6078_c0_g1~~TRINITY_DN6078_c0_g1_i2.p2  ORF type:complete len:110 (-),score=0.72 TRINITY_DN6078_c0_g1_i2:27-356(-)